MKKRGEGFGVFKNQREAKMDDKKINTDDIEMISNLQADINNIILQQAMKNIDKLDKTAQDTINNIQHDINKTIKEYLIYILNK